ncbi:Cingulin [Gossypium arboreum]|uniref:Cingulin n=1 Tax=Gossypium arboreum TaxID=29729 RepID=A0A0B0N2B3_GOSAR|nr:Cingulin [Gossypium arboreum]
MSFQRGYISQNFSPRNHFAPEDRRSFQFWPPATGPYSPTRRRSRWSKGARKKSSNGRITGVDGGLKSGGGVGEALTLPKASKSCCDVRGKSYGWKP